MGTWGVHSFDNDSAADFLAELADADQPYERAEAVRAAFDAVFADAHDLDADLASVAIAGADVVASALGQPKAGDEADPYELKASFRFYEDSVGKAVAALRLSIAENSELFELWNDSDEIDDWRASVADLEARLLAAAKAHDLNPAFEPPAPGELSDAAERSVLHQISQSIIEEFRSELENLADRNKGDPSIEVLRLLARSIFRTHTDITNLHYALTSSIDTLSERIAGLERRLND